MTYKLKIYSNNLKQFTLENFLAEFDIEINERFTFFDLAASLNIKDENLAAFVFDKEDKPIAVYDANEFSADPNMAKMFFEGGE